jgi:hypothetical protein
VVRLLKVLFASFIVAICIIAVCFMFGPYLFGLDAVADAIGGNIALITGLLTLGLAPLVYKYLH